MRKFDLSIFDKTVGEDLYQTGAKSDEEIQQYMIQDNMPDLLRTQYILQMGDNIQKAAVIRQIPYLIKEDESLEETLISNLVGGIECKNKEVQQVIGEVFAQMIKQKISKNFESVDFLVDTFELCLTMFRLNINQVSESWIPVLQQILTKIPFQKIENHLFKYFKEYISTTKPSQSQIIAINVFAILINQNQFKIILPKKLEESIQLSIQFCLDDIKLIFAEQIIEKLIIYFQNDEKQQQFWKLQVLEFINYNNRDIQEASIELLAKVTQYFNKKEIKEKILPQFIDYCQSQDKTIKELFSFHFGQILVSVKNGILIPEEQSFLINKYIEEGLESSNQQIKINLIYNLPGILQAMGNQYWSNIVKQYTKNIQKDSIDVKIQAIKSLDGIVQEVGVVLMLPFLNKNIPLLLKDQELEIQCLIVDKLHILFQRIITLNDEQMKQSSFSSTNKITILNQIDTKALINTIQQQTILILQKTKNISGWRIGISIIKFYNKNFNNLNKNEIVDSYMPTIIDILDQGSMELKKKCIESIIEFLKTNYPQHRKEEIIFKLKNQYELGSNSSQRLIYLHFIELCLENFSQKFFQEHGLFSVVSLGRDRIKSIKIKISGLLYKLRLFIQDSDQIYVNMFKDILSHLQDENNNDIIYNVMKIEKLFQYNDELLKKEKKKIEQELKERYQNEQQLIEQESQSLNNSNQNIQDNFKSQKNRLLKVKVGYTQRATSTNKFSGNSQNQKQIQNNQNIQILINKNPKRNISTAGYSTGTSGYSSSSNNNFYKRENIHHKLSVNSPSSYNNLQNNGKQNQNIKPNNQQFLPSINIKKDINKSPMQQLYRDSKDSFLNPPIINRDRKLTTGNKELNTQQLQQQIQKSKSQDKSKSQRNLQRQQDILKQSLLKGNQSQRTVNNKNNIKKPQIPKPKFI